MTTVWGWAGNGGYLARLGGNLTAGWGPVGGCRYLFQPGGSGGSAHSTAGAAVAIRRPARLGRLDRVRQMRRMWFMAASLVAGQPAVASSGEDYSGARSCGRPGVAGSTVATGEGGYHTEPPIREPT